jgi:hypothetical protein
MRQFRRYAERTRQGRNRRNKGRDGETQRKTGEAKKNLWNQEKPVKPRKICETKKNL